MMDEVPSEETTIPLAVKVSDDKMVVTVTCSVSADELDDTREALGAALGKLNLCEEAKGIDLNEWLKAEMGKAEAEKIEGAVFFQGKRPVPPEEGYIEWKGKFFEKGFIVDPETGATDYRRQTAQTTVRADQFLAQAIPPVEGEEGVDVFGKRVKTGKARAAKIKVGKNVRHNDEDDTFYATSDGRIRWYANTLAVNEVFTVAGDVGLETGHIDHPGALVVQGDILEGSRIRTIGNIEVMGVVEPCDIEAGGNLIVHGGLTGSEGHRCVVGGGVQARFILDANIEAGEDVVADKEILHSRVCSRGAVTVARGRIVGGEIMALGGVQVEETGSDADVVTSFKLGEDFALPEKLSGPEAKLSALEGNIAKIHTVVRPLLSKVDSLPEAKMTAVKKLAGQAKQLGEDAEELREEIELIRSESTERAKYKAVVMKTIHPESRFSIRTDMLRVRKTITGPVQAALQKGLVALLPVRDG